MKSDRPKSHLKIVESKTPVHQSFDLEKMLSKISLARSSSLFPEYENEALIFIKYSELRDVHFLRIIEEIKPQRIIDVRRVPRFDLGNLTRQGVFQIFKSINARYFDLIGLLRKKYEFDREMHIEIANHANLLIDSKKNQPFGTILFLCDDQYFSYKYIDAIQDSVIPSANDDWAIHFLPAPPHESSRYDGKWTIVESSGK